MTKGAQIAFWKTFAQKSGALLLNFFRPVQACIDDVYVPINCSLLFSFIDM